MKEINYLRENGFDTRLVKISGRTHAVTEQHIEEDKQKYSKTLMTGNGIGPCYRDKYLRVGENSQWMMLNYLKTIYGIKASMEIYYVKVHKGSG